MPFDSSGTYNRVIPGGWKADAQAGIKIRADRHDDEDDGFALGLSTCITKDGRTQPTANLPMNGKRHTNVGEPVDPADGATKKYIDDKFGSAVAITGIDEAGRINFSGSQSPLATGKPLGFSFTQADLFFGVKPLDIESVGKLPRFVWNDKGDGMGTDVATMDETGAFTTAGAFTAASVAATGAVTAASVAATGAVTGGSVTSTGTVFAGAGGSMVFRPYGSANATNQVSIDGAGSLHNPGNVNPGPNGIFNANGYANVSVLANLRTKDGLSGGFTGNFYTWTWGGTGQLYAYLNNTLLGYVSFISDYRIKKDITPLASTWDRVKTFRPVSYTQKAYGELFQDDDAERWSFIAHEIQEDLLMTAASGTKDMPNGVQGLDWMPILAATVKALQEAMARIEALEAQLAGAP